MRVLLYWVMAGVCLPATLLAVSCGDDDGVEADQQLVGAACDSDSDCETEDDDVAKRCLMQFKGGYCGASDCERNSECPEGSACVQHEGSTYCFRICTDKVECNANRAPEDEANCSSSVEFASGKKEGKVCLPPTGS